jgi:hypothetical protein
MIWVRRISAIPLIILFVILFIVVLLVTQVNSTFANPGFYNDQLQRADMYNFVYDTALPAALDELKEDNSSDIPIDITNIEDEVVSAARKIVTPHWLQDQVEAATNTIIPYFLGKTDRFTYTVAFQDRVTTAAQVIKSDLLQGDTFTSLYDDGISYAADKMLENLDRVPYSITLSKERIENFLRAAAPEDWVSSQATAAIDAVTPYATGDSDHFTIIIHFKDLVDPTAAAALVLLKGQDTYNYLLDEIITPIVLENIGTSVNLGYGVTLSHAEIASAIKQVLPQSWVEARLGELINAIADYVKGEATTLQITVNLADRKAAALDVLTTLADQKLEARFNSLPVCSMAQFLQIVQTLPPGSAPSCRPSGVSYRDFKTTLSLNVANSVDHAVGDSLPNQWVYTEADLRQSLGADNADFLDKARNWVSSGWTFTDADLVDKLDSDQEQTLNDARGWIKNGYTVTEADLRDRIAETDADLDNLDTVRHRIDTGTTWLWALWVIPFASLVIIALLCGRNWISRLAWGLAVLFVTSLIIYIAVSVTYSHVGVPRLVTGVIDTSQYEGVGAIMAEKGNEVIRNVAGAFAWGTERTTIYFMIGSGIVLLGLIVWRVVLPRTRGATL